MELFRTKSFYIIFDGKNSLWWNRHTGALTPKLGMNMKESEVPICLGLCDGILGKVEHSVFDAKLLIIKESEPVGKLHHQNIVNKIKSVVFIPSGLEDVDLNLNECSKHDRNASKKTSSTHSIFDLSKSTALTKTWGSLKNAGNSLKSTTQQAAAIATSTQKKRDLKDKFRFEKQIVEEFYKIFNDTNSFYYCRTCDITNSLQRLCDLEKNKRLADAKWKTVDDRFFWNKHMLKDLIESNDPLSDPWILPVIQGFVQIEECKVEIANVIQGVETTPKFEIFALSIISRRNRHRAGTRYNRRGVDEQGHCANYVETEQIISYQHHEVSFVQVRGSVPIYWSQPGYKYRPPPKVDKGEADTKFAFEKHFSDEIRAYGPVTIVNLIDQCGKEKVIWDGYTQYVFDYNSPFLTYVTFDFHEYCRGMHFENVSILINNITDVIKNMNYCWRDEQGHICSQNGIFRVNCIDCLDRTNIVQTAIGKAVMEIQFYKLGLISPEGTMPDSIKTVFQVLWANNGDLISKQYAGTNALKGDYTRTGERKFTGMMKDGMNSASRYYLSRFKDSTRQGTIDLMLGNSVSEDIFKEVKDQQFEEDSQITAEHVKLLIEDCKKLLINTQELILGAWGLINADPYAGDPNETEMDIILILTRDSYFVSDYDDQVDRMTKYQRVLLKDLTLLECGLPDNLSSFFRSGTNRYCIRLNYKVNDTTGYYHMFRSTNLRFFNNMAVTIKSDEEEIESLKAICEAFIVALDICGLPAIPYLQGSKLERRKSKIVGINHPSSSVYLDILEFPHLARNVSESQLFGFKHAGSKAISNVTQQFSKLQKIGSSIKMHKTKAVKSGNSTSLQNYTSSDSEEEYENSIFDPNSLLDNENLMSSPNDFLASNKGGIIKPERIYDNYFLESSVPCNKSLDHFLPSVGIVVMCSKTDSGALHNVDDVLESKENKSITNACSPVNDMQLFSVTQNVSIQNPEIQINSEMLEESDNTLLLQNLAHVGHKWSHSSGEVDSDGGNHSLVSQLCGSSEKRSNSEHDLALNISQSQSESALKCKFAAVTSPVANVTKDLLVSRFSKLAKGVQNFGANLDPRKFSVGNVKEISEINTEQHRNLKEKWSNCKTKLIAL